MKVDLDSSYLRSLLDHRSAIVIVAVVAAVAAVAAVRAFIVIIAKTIVAIRSAGVLGCWIALAILIEVAL